MAIGNNLIENANTISDGDLTLGGEDLLGAAPVATSRFKRKTDQNDETPSTATEDQSALATSGIAANSANASLNMIPDGIPDQLDLSDLDVIGTGLERSYSGTSQRSFSQDFLDSIHPVYFTGGAEDSTQLHVGSDYVIIRIELLTNNDVGFIDSEPLDANGHPTNYHQPKEQIGATGTRERKFHPENDQLLFVIEDHQPITRSEQGALFDALNWGFYDANDHKLKITDRSQVTFDAEQQNRSIIEVFLNVGSGSPVAVSGRRFIPPSDTTTGYTWDEITAGNLFGNSIRIISRNQLLLKSDLTDNPATYSGVGISYGKRTDETIYDISDGTKAVTSIIIDLGQVTDSDDGVRNRTQPDGVTRVTYTWYQVDDGVATKIDGATSSEYDLTDSDFGKKIRAIVHFTDDNDNLEIFSFETGGSIVAFVDDNQAPEIIPPTDLGYTDGFQISKSTLSTPTQTISVVDLDATDTIYVTIIQGTLSQTTASVTDHTVSLNHGSVTIRIDQATYEVTWQYTISREDHTALSANVSDSFSIAVTNSPAGTNPGDSRIDVPVTISAENDPPAFTSAGFSGTVVPNLTELSVSSDRAPDSENLVNIGLFAPHYDDPDSTGIPTDYRLKAVDAEGTPILNRFFYGPNSGVDGLDAFPFGTYLLFSRTQSTESTPIFLMPGPRIFGAVTLTHEAINQSDSTIIDTVSTETNDLNFDINVAPTIEATPTGTMPVINRGSLFFSDTYRLSGSVPVNSNNQFDLITATLTPDSGTHYGTIFISAIRGEPNGQASVNWRYALDPSNPLSSIAGEVTDTFTLTVTDEGGETATRDIVFRIQGTDIPDSAPIFDAVNPFVITVSSSNLSVVSVQGGEIGLRANASDPDTFDRPPAYSLVAAANHLNVDLLSRFSIHPRTGEISVASGFALDDAITFTVRAADFTNETLFAEADHTFIFHALDHTIQGDQIIAGKDNLSGSLPFSTALTNFTIAGTQTPLTISSTFSDARGAHGTLSIARTDEGQLDWRYIPSSDRSNSSNLTDDFSIMVDETTYNLAFTITPVSEALKNATSIQITPGSGENIKTPVPTIVASTKYIILGSDAADTITGGDTGDIIDLGRGVDKITLTERVEAVDTIIYDFDVRSPAGWIAVDGSDTYVGFQRGTDKLILRAFTNDGKDPLDDADRNSNIKVSNIRENIGGTDMITGIAIQFAASGSGYGNIQAGNTLTIKFATPITIEALAGILPVGSYDTKTLEVFDVSVAGQSVFDHIFATRGNTAPTDNFDIVVLDPSSNNPATGAPTIVNNNGVFSLDLTAIADTDGIDTSTYSYEWYKFDVDVQAIVFLGDGDSYMLTAGDIGDAIRATLTFQDMDANAETLSTVSHRISATDMVTPNIASTDFTNADYIASAHDDVPLLIDVL